MFRKVLIANRGEIAVRIQRSLKKMGIGSVAIYSDADRHSMHVRLADESVCVGPAPVTESYLNADAIIAACRDTGAEAVHPGYGFLSENPDFADRCKDAGISFIGPTSTHMREFGLKHTARSRAKDSGVPLLPGSDLIHDVETAREEAKRIGFPVMLKSTAGGGGIGLQLCESEDELPELFETVTRLAETNFANPGLFIEKFVAKARHIEVQIFGDGRGHVVALGERDCSLQRRNQKVVEETPAPRLPESTRQKMIQAAISLGEAVSYRSAGTIEFIYDEAEDAFYFLEVNTRLQVEHPVTEQVTGVDLVEWMVALAAGDLDLAKESESISNNGASIEVRLYAEDPGNAFKPSSGTLTHVSFPKDVRVETWIDSGTDVPMFYDPMIAKLIVTGRDREEAALKLQEALAQTEIYGIETNLAYLRSIAESELFQSGKVYTKALDTFEFIPDTVDVLAPGTQSALQDWPGREGYWHVGVPPSGPMDALNHRLANTLVGNDSGAAVLEMTMMGPSLRFNTDALIAITGTEMQATLDGVSLSRFETISIAAGQTLSFGQAREEGVRGYLAVSGGFDAPLYLNSRATFDLGGFGGHGVGNLKSGDVLRLYPSRTTKGADKISLPAPCSPTLTHSWEIGVLYGPHGAPDFFQQEDIDTLLSHPYEVHFNSARTGVRLIGPKPEWARPDGGEAGLHPSNIHDNAYAVGAIDFTGDMPIILGPDGPSLGGFTCPFVIAKAEMWKTGQLKPGDTVQFKQISLAQAEALEREQEKLITRLFKSLHHNGDAPSTMPSLSTAGSDKGEDAVLCRDEDRDIPVCYRRAGEDYLLVEFGPQMLDLDLRVKAHLLMERLHAEQDPAIIDLTPGIRSLQVHFNNHDRSPAQMLDQLRALERELPDLDEVQLPSRIVHMPLSWDDETTREATQRYQETVRSDAPWCPWNIEFIRRINGLDSVEAVKDIVFGADYMVYGLGDVYLGAPVATPVDPRHRLVTTKYNPARTWTPQNAVGIGGAYMCVYGMEGPGGYQFVGRTVQIWNTHRQVGNFQDGSPWLLRFFDRIKFFPVSPEELMERRAGFLHGDYPLKIEEQTFSLSNYHQFLSKNQAAIDAFRAGREAAFDAERRAWEAQGIAAIVDEDLSQGSEDALDLADGMIAVEAPMNASLWKVLVESGQQVEPGQKIAILEAMKTEIPVTSLYAGQVVNITRQPGQIVKPGDPLVTLKRKD